MKPELDDQGAVLDEHALVVDDAIEFSIQLGVIAQIVDPMLQGCQVPAAEEDRHLTPGRQGAPETPVAGALTLLVGLVPVGEGLEAAGVEPFVETVHHLALAGPLDPGDEDDDGDVGLAQLTLDQEQFGAQLLLLSVEGLLVDLAAKLDGFEHAVPPCAGC